MNNLKFPKELFKRNTLSLRDCLGIDEVDHRYWDNVAITAGSGTSIATDTIGGAEYQRIKIVHGADGVNAGDVATGNPLPVVQTGAQTIKESFGTVTALTITLASLATSTAGVGRQSTLVDNTSDLFTSALIYAKITVGTSPTANTPIYLYLVRYDNSAIADDIAGTSDAALTVKNASLLGIINCTATTSDQAYQAVFDTSALGPLGPKWGIAVVHSTGVNLNATGGNHVINYIGVKKAI